MAFTVPNEADAFQTDQAEPDSVDFGILAARHNADGVLHGCAVTAQGTPDMTVAVAAGAVTVAGGRAAVSAGNVTITAADGSNPRFDLIVVNSAGTKSATAGTAAANPVFPAIPATSTVLAAVYVPASDTTIAANQITDKRLFTGRSFERFTASGTWTKPTAATGVYVEAFGAGGGGGGGRGGAAGTARNGGGGGGGGGRAFFILPASVLAATETVTIGAGGTEGNGGSSGAGADGTAGGNSTFGSFLTGYGGGFGNGDSAAGTGNGGGGGGGSAAVGVNASGAAGGTGGGVGPANINAGFGGAS